MKKGIKQVSILFLIVLLALTGCGNNNANTGQGKGGGEKEGQGANMRIGMVTDQGGVNDKSFNQSAWEGLQKLEKETGTKVKYLQSKIDAEFTTNLNTFIKDQYALTWGIGFMIADSLKEVAAQNPNAKLGIIDNVVNAPNVQSITFAENEGSFLVGVVAALVSKTGKVGFVGGIESPLIKKFEAGFKAGVAAANPSVKVNVNYTGAFDKPDAGKAAAASLYNNGNDIIFHAAGATGNGVFNEAKDRLKNKQQVWVIGVDKDQSLEYGDEVTLTSMVKKVDEAIYGASRSVIDGKFQGGKTITLGLKDNGVGLADTSKKNVPEDILKKVDDFQKKIINGEIKVPLQ